MSSPDIKINVVPKPIIKGKMDAHFPSRVDAEAPILLDKTGGNYSFSLDMNAINDMIGVSFQPVDADLTAIAALTTTAYGRSLLALANATALAAEVDSFFLTPDEGSAAYQPLDSDLTAIAALTTASYGRSFLELADAAAARSLMGLAAGASAARKNLCTNPGMQVWQNDTTLAAMAHRTVLADGYLWGSQVGASVWTGSRSTDVPDSSVPASISVQVTTADTSPTSTVDRHIRWAVYGRDFEPFANSDMIVKFWVKAKKTGINSVCCINETRTHCYVAEYTVNAADAWEEKTVTIPFGSKAGTWNLSDGFGFGLRWSVVAGAAMKTAPNIWTAGNFTASTNQINNGDNTSNYFRITKVQVYPVACPPFELPTYDDALASALRQYRVISTDVAGVNLLGVSSNINTVNIEFVISPPMMAPPVISTKGVWDTDIGTETVNGVAVTAAPLTSYARSRHLAKFTLDKGAAFTVGQPYVLRLKTTSGKLVLDGHLI